MDDFSFLSYNFVKERDVRRYHLDTYRFAIFNRFWLSVLYGPNCFFNIVDENLLETSFNLNLE